MNTILFKSTDYMLNSVKSNKWFVFFHLPTVAADTPGFSTGALNQGVLLQNTG